MSLINPIVKINNGLISILEDSTVKYCVLIVLTVLILFIDKLHINYIEVFDNTMFKIIYALFIAYTVCIDPIYAILLTTFMIMVIQELHLRKSLTVLSNLNNNDNNNDNNNNSNSKNSKHTKNNINNLKNIKDIINKNSSQSIIFKESEISNTINEIDYDIENDIKINLKQNKDTLDKQTLDKGKEKMANISEEIKSINDKYYEDPAFKTITNNLQEQNRINDTQFFVTDDDLMNVQSNKIENGLMTLDEVKLCTIQGYDHLQNSSSEF